MLASGFDLLRTAADQTSCGGIPLGAYALEKLGISGLWLWGRNNELMVKPTCDDIKSVFYYDLNQATIKGRTKKWLAILFFQKWELENKFREKCPRLAIGVQVLKAGYMEDVGEKDCEVTFRRRPSAAERQKADGEALRTGFIEQQVYGVSDVEKCKNLVRKFAEEAPGSGRGTRIGGKDDVKELIESMLTTAVGT